ncbi:MAG: 2-hydroxyacyl-CoA dehydratase [Candidatus Izimaplasma sp.]|nr:2-hydroxyacyl-CoA dehydratase [Candidatus Izimaplasma bacterium]
MAKLIYEGTRVIFTKEMKKEYKILIPSMAPYHFDFFIDILESEGYQAEILQNHNFDLINEGMKYSHNDICVPAMLVIGQFIDAIKTGGYDIHKIAVVISQTGGGCRASNYLSLIRKAFIKAGYEFIPIVSFNSVGLESNPGFKITNRMIFKLTNSLIFGDILMQVVNEVIPYEVNPGETMRVYKETHELLAKSVSYNDIRAWLQPKRLIEKVIKRFAEIEVDRSIKKPKVGVVGEIYVKYSPLGNNNLEQVLRDEGCEVITPSIFDFFLYTFDSTAYDIKNYGGSQLSKIKNLLTVEFVEKRKKVLANILDKYGFVKPLSYKEIKGLAKGFIGHGTHVGEGWLLTAEMVHLIHNDVPNIVCTQPFGCLPNHIAGKGMIKRIKDNFPESNIVTIDYDTSATEINQLNRIRLMISNAKKNLK